MRRDLDIALLRAFVAIVDTGSVTGAARLLNRTQAAVSLQLKRLEDQLGQPLFERVHKRLILAAAGEQLLGSAQRLIAMNDDIWGQMTTPSFQGEVRLGVPVDLISTYIPQILRRFRSAWPRVHVSLVCRNSQELLEDDAAGRPGEIEVPTRGRPLGTAAPLAAGVAPAVRAFDDPACADGSRS